MWCGLRREAVLVEAATGEDGLRGTFKWVGAKPGWAEVDSNTKRWLVHRISTLVSFAFNPRFETMSLPSISI